jgi:hypothetical protein
MAFYKKGIMKYSAYGEFPHNHGTYAVRVGEFFCSIQAAQKAIGIRKKDINNRDIKLYMADGTFQITRVFDYNSKVPNYT